MITRVRGRGIRSERAPVIPISHKEKEKKNAPSCPRRKERKTISGRLPTQLEKELAWFREKKINCSAFTAGRAKRGGFKILSTRSRWSSRGGGGEIKIRLTEDMGGKRKGRSKRFSVLFLFGIPKAAGKDRRNPLLELTQRKGSTT